ncbi:MAG: potassium transporter TrkG [Pseudomonadota bacterium]|nr:potassium transporter TrkG [Pseudomonadota bacterium]
MKRHAAVFLVLSWIVMGFSFAFLVPMAWDWFHEDGRNTRVWAWCFAFTLATGGWLWARVRHTERELAVRDGFLLVTLVWVVLPAYAALPLLHVVPGIGFARAYFEAMSGLTATGATTLSGLDALATSVNIWRCFLQLIGGLGIMLLAVAILPMLGLGGTQLYKAEMPGPMKDQRLTPRVAETARGLWSVYFVLSLACLLAYRAGGMSWPDAFMHMCTTVGLGGLSSHDASFGYWNSAQLEWVAVLFMALSGISFARYFMVWRLRSLAPVAHDTEVRAYAGILLGATALVMAMLLIENVYPDAGTALRQAAFQVVSVATTTGYATTDYMLWPSFVPVLLLFLGCFVSCAGSTGGGIKLVRMLVLVKLAQRELVRIVHPRVVRPIVMGRSVLHNDVVSAVMAFMLIYGGVMVLLTLVLLASGMDVVTAFSAIIACLNNIGPGMGRIGPAGNFGTLSEFQVWVCSLAMLLGRLELLSVLVLFTPQFWKK